MADKITGGHAEHTAGASVRARLCEGLDREGMARERVKAPRRADLQQIVSVW